MSFGASKIASQPISQQVSKLLQRQAKDAKSLVLQFLDPHNVPSILMISLWSNYRSAIYTCLIIRTSLFPSGASDGPNH